MINKIKIKFGTPKFNVIPKHKVVVCECEYKIVTPKDLRDIDNFLYYASKNNIDTFDTYIVKSVARVKNKDVFDAEKGKKIAFTKAQNKAYKDLMDTLSITLNNINQLKHICDSNWHLAGKYIDRNERFLMKQ